jgi:hypothetical protein
LRQRAPGAWCRTLRAMSTAFILCTVVGIALAIAFRALRR